MARRRETQKLTSEEKQEKRKAILAALAKASEDSDFIGTVKNLTPRELQDYYTLSRDEMEALINGNMAKIEEWVSNMDKNHAAKLLYWLVKERW